MGMRIAAAGLVAASALALALAPAGPVSAAAPVSPAGMRGLGSADRVIVVATTGAHTTHATVRTYRRRGTTWRLARGPMPARIGRNGLSRPAYRHEGDGTTPEGNYGFVFDFGSRSDPGVHGFRWRALVPGSCWAGTRSHYNRWVHRHPCAPGDEDLWVSRRVAYRYSAVIDFNYARPIYGRGSGIFLHEQTGRPTAGCVSLNQSDLLAVLRWMRPGTRIVIGTESYLRHLKA